MIQFIDHVSVNLVAFRIEDKVTAEDIDQIADVLEMRFDSGEEVNLYIEIADSLEESFGGILEQLKKAFTVILPNLGKIKKAALVTDKNWLKKVADFKGLFLSMEIRGFSSAERDEALNWAAQQLS